MSEQNKKYESVLVGWADEPSYNDNGELMGWSFPPQGQRAEGLY